MGYGFFSFTFFNAPDKHAKGKTPTQEPFTPTVERCASANHTALSVNECLNGYVVVHCSCADSWLEECVINTAITFITNITNIC